MLEYPAAFLALLGAWLNARRNRWGFVLWLASNLCWLGFAIPRGYWGLTGQYAAFSVIWAYGFWTWGRRDNSQNCSVCNKPTSIAHLAAEPIGLDEHGATEWGLVCPGCADWSAMS